MKTATCGQTNPWQQETPDSSTVDCHSFRFPLYHGVPQESSCTREHNEVDSSPIACNKFPRPISIHGHTDETAMFIIDTSGNWNGTSVQPENPGSVGGNLHTSLCSGQLVEPVCTLSSNHDGNIGCNLVTSSNDVTAHFLQASGYNIEQTEQETETDKGGRTTMRGSCSGTSNVLSLDENDLEQNPTLKVAINNPEIWNILETFDSPEKEEGSGYSQIQTKGSDNKSPVKMLKYDAEVTSKRENVDTQIAENANCNNREHRRKTKMIKVKRKYSKKSGFSITREFAMQQNKLCSCPADISREAVPVEQVFVRDGQMYRLPEASVIKLGDLEFYAFIKDNQCFLSLALFFREVGREVQRLFEREIMQQLGKLQLQEMGDNEMELLRQKCQLSSLTKIKDLINLADLVTLSRCLLHKQPSNKIVCMLATGLVFQKVLEASALRCSLCGLPCKTVPDNEDFVPLKVVLPEEEEDVTDGQKEVVVINDYSVMTEDEICIAEYTVGTLNVKNENLTAFTVEEKTYLSVKEIVRFKLMGVSRLQKKMTVLGFRPVQIPEELDDQLGVHWPHVCDSLWIDIVQLRCCLCMGQSKKPSDLIGKSLVHKVCSGDYSFIPRLSLCCKKIDTDKQGVVIHDKTLAIVRDNLDKYTVSPKGNSSFQIAKICQGADNEQSINGHVNKTDRKKNPRSALRTISSSPDTTTDLNVMSALYDDGTELKSACENPESVVIHDSMSSSEVTLCNQAGELHSTSPVAAHDRQINKENEEALIDAVPANVTVEPESYFITDQHLSPEHFADQNVVEEEKVVCVTDRSPEDTLVVVSSPVKKVAAEQANESNKAILEPGRYVVIDRDEFRKQMMDGGILLKVMASNEGIEEPDSPSGTAESSTFDSKDEKLCVAEHSGEDEQETATGNYLPGFKTKDVGMLGDGILKSLVLEPGKYIVSDNKCFCDLVLGKAVFLENGSLCHFDMEGGDEAKEEHQVRAEGSSDKIQKEDEGPKSSPGKNEQRHVSVETDHVSLLIEQKTPDLDAGNENADMETDDQSHSGKSAAPESVSLIEETSKHYASDITEHDQDKRMPEQSLESVAELVNPTSKDILKENNISENSLNNSTSGVHTSPCQTTVSMHCSNQETAHQGLEEGNISRQASLEVESCVNDEYTSTVSNHQEVSLLCVKQESEIANSDEAVSQEIVDMDSSEDVGKLGAEYASDEEVGDKQEPGTPQKHAQSHMSPPSTSTPITLRKSCSASRVDKWYTKIAPLNISNSPDVSLQMLATIATAETDPDSGAESDVEGQGGWRSEGNIFNNDKCQANQAPIFPFTLTEEKKKALEDEKEALEANMKKFLVFNVTKGIPPKFSVLRFKPGAEEVFPVLFYPDPNHPRIANKRKHFMTAAAKYLENKYYQHVRSLRNSSQEKTPTKKVVCKIPKLDSSITPIKNRRAGVPDKDFETDAPNLHNTSVETSETVTLLKEKIKLNLLTLIAKRRNENAIAEEQKKNHSNESSGLTNCGKDLRSGKRLDNKESDIESCAVRDMKTKKQELNESPERRGNRKLRSGRSRGDSVTVQEDSLESVNDHDHHAEVVVENVDVETNSCTEVTLVASRKSSDSGSLKADKNVNNKGKGRAVVDKDGKGTILDDSSSNGVACVHLRKLKFLDDVARSYYKNGSSSGQDESEVQTQCDTDRTATADAEKMAGTQKRKAAGTREQQPRKLRKR